MSDMRLVPMTAEQAEELDRCIELLMRANRNERATTLMTLRFAWSAAQPQEKPLPNNVIDMFGYSRKVPCA